MSININIVVENDWFSDMQRVYYYIGCKHSNGEKNVIKGFIDDALKIKKIKGEYSCYATDIFEYLDNKQDTFVYNEINENTIYEYPFAYPGELNICHDSIGSIEIKIPAMPIGVSRENQIDFNNYLNEINEEKKEEIDNMDEKFKKYAEGDTVVPGNSLHAEMDSSKDECYMDNELVMYAESSSLHAEMDYSKDECEEKIKCYKNIREEVLSKANGCVNGPREHEYGTPDRSFSNIAKLWSAYKDVEFTPTDAAVMLALLKVARIKGNEASLDSFVDGAGYFACAAEVTLNKK